MADGDTDSRDKPVFVGIARASDVSAHLSGTPHPPSATCRSPVPRVLVESHAKRVVDPPERDDAERDPDAEANDPGGNLRPYEAHIAAAGPVLTGGRNPRELWARAPTR